MTTKKTAVTQLNIINLDPLRADQGEWELTPEGINFVPKSSTNYHIKDYGSSFRIAMQTPTADPSFSELVEQTITVQINPSAGQTAREFADFVEENSIGRDFDYFVTTLESGLTYEELIRLDIDETAPDLGVDFEYNYLDTDYERILDGVTDHNLIPSMYEILDETLITDITGTFLENKLSAPTSEVLTDNIERALLMPRTELTNQIFTSKNNSYLRDYEGNKFLFPMYCQINMPFETSARIGKAIEDSNLGACLLRDYFGIYDSAVYGAPSAMKGRPFDYSYTFYDANGVRNVENATVNSVTLDLQDWMLNDLGGWVGGIPLPSDNNTSFLGVDAEEAEISQESHPIKFLQGLAILNNSIDNILTPDTLTRDLPRRSETRSFEDMINGRACYSEILMYKVVKYLGDGIDTPIQTFYFMNTEELESEMLEKRINLIDTQVKFNQSYTYSVTAIQAVVANRYRYTGVRVATNDTVDIDVETTPYIRIIELPYFQVTGRILSNPPLSPEVNFVPFRGMPDSLLFHFNTALGSEDLIPIALTTEEEDDVRQIAINQKRTDGAITFETDDYSKAFNIYRLAKKPVSYKDFESSLLTTISTVGDGLESDKDAGSANIIIKQTTNKKYYYMFRSVDIHGLLSNPSEVYEIELYNDGGAGYPIIRKYDFVPIDPRSTTKSARKIIQIVPRITQSFLNVAESNLTDDTQVEGKDNFTLGIEDDPLFGATSGFNNIVEGKKFKIRLTSRSTGKKVDINIDFNTIRVRSEIE